MAGLNIRPLAASEVETLQQEWRRAYRATNQVAEGMTKLQWKVQRAGVWALSDIRPGWISIIATFLKLAYSSWERSLFNEDSKVDNPLTDSLHPYLEFHRNLI